MSDCADRTLNFSFDQVDRATPKVLQKMEIAIQAESEIERGKRFKASTGTLEITHNGRTVGNPEVRVARPDGTYESNIPLQLPKTADPGEYRVRMTVKTPKGSDSKETAFRVG
jgi:hypothetical protein